ncbi:MAG: chemotaxis protein CheW, partial [Acidimicrobiia bacterium]
GVGTTLVVKIPLTLAIIPALVVGLGDAHYAISQVNLVELVRIEASNLDQLERIGDASVFRLRGKLLPVIALGDVLGSPRNEAEQDSLTLVVLSADGRQFGVVVDEVRDTQEIVVKPLGSHLAGIDVYAGTTIMGDGSVALILDAPGLATRARVADDRHARAPEDVVDVEAGDLRSEVQTLVVCEVGPRRFAVPIGLVDRLEEVSAADIELAAGREVVQYRGGLLSIIRLSDVFGVSGANLDPIPLLVHLDEGQLIGLAVDRIIDIVDETAGVGRAWSGDYVDYSGVIGRRVTDLIDLRALVASTRPYAADLVSVGPWNEADLDTGDGFHVG